MATGLRDGADTRVPGTFASTQGSRSSTLAARLEPFDSYWQAPDDVEKGYDSFYRYYKHNYLPRMPQDRNARILVVSCGPGYLVNMLRKEGYAHVTGIDSDPEKVAHAVRRNLDCRAARAFEWLEGVEDEYDVILPEQELNHLTLDEQIEFLRLCRTALRTNGYVHVYGLNGANPLVGSENLAHNIDHFNTFTEHSLAQVLKLAGFERIETLPLSIYVFWTNPLNYVGLAFTKTAELFFRAAYKMYGKNVRILTKKIAAVAYKPAVH